MSSYLIFRGAGTEGSASVVGAANVLSNVYVNKMPDHRKAAMRQTEYHVKGRDGTLHIDEGFDNFDITVRLILIDAPATARQIVNAWADGYGKLITSDNTSLAYKAIVKDEIEWHRDVAAAFIPAFSSTKQYYSGDFCIYSGSIYQFNKNHIGTWVAADADIKPWLVKGVYDVADITFNCDPFMYEAADTVLTLTESQSISNPGSADAFPLIKVECTANGDVDMTIAGSYIEIEGMVTTDPIFIDCANGYIYSASGSAKSITGDIPFFDLGTNSIVFGTNLARLTITPHWRWV